MEFVFSFWYFVMLFLVAGIVACFVVFFKMDKKDKVMIDEFIKSSSKPQAEEKSNVEQTNEQSKE